MILDGWGISAKQEGNAIAHARTPVMHELLSRHPSTLLSASGEAVGLPHGLMGNSEVGHLNIGAGRVVIQPILRISRAIADGSFFANPALLGAIKNVKDRGTSLHLIGLLSDGRVHSSMEHLLALLDLARRHKLGRVYLHLSLDGRDTPPRSALTYLDQLEAMIRKFELGVIASLGGRYYAMDRDRHWERVRPAYEACVHAHGHRVASARAAVEEAYARGESDERIRPVVIGHGAEVKDGDSVISFNFRPERAREMTRMFTDPTLDDVRGESPPRVHYVCMTVYDHTFQLPVAFPVDDLRDVLAEVLSRHNRTQFHTAETEKYAHVTSYLNGGRSTPFPGEKWRLIPSPRVATYDLRPQMSAIKLTKEVVRRVTSQAYDLVVVNYANPDMVGHTGVMKATIRAVETIDKCVEDVVASANKVRGVCLVTADHGNAEEMLDEQTGEVRTAHSTNKVPFIMIGAGPVKLRSGILADVAPTILELFGIEKPEAMTGRSLIVRGRRREPAALKR